ncbi:hypothetical protein QVD17_03897 [Tagetes erecta]|uniref:Uncharacterized protein n=1 Tax=Tagetes erecta TaxID=13708 RepID=A0AAD8PA19_TARER|nr:hypothetical protein QVD17_03897 [Tagetes erecta]
MSLFARTCSLLNDRDRSLEMSKKSGNSGSKMPAMTGLAYVEPAKTTVSVNAVKGEATKQSSSVSSSGELKSGYPDVYTGVLKKYITYDNNGRRGYAGIDD